MWDLSSLTRNQTHAPALGGEVLTSGPPEKFLHLPLDMLPLLC